MFHLENFTGPCSTFVNYHNMTLLWNSVASRISQRKCFLNTSSTISGVAACNKHFLALFIAMSTLESTQRYGMRDAQPKSYVAVCYDLEHFLLLFFFFFSVTASCSNMHDTPLKSAVSKRLSTCPLRSFTAAPTCCIVL